MSPRLFLFSPARLLRVHHLQVLSVHSEKVHKNHTPAFPQGINQLKYFKFTAVGHIGWTDKEIQFNSHLSEISRSNLVVQIFSLVARAIYVLNPKVDVVPCSKTWEKSFNTFQIIFIKREYSNGNLHPASTDDLRMLYCILLSLLLPKSWDYYFSMAMSDTEEQLR